MPVFRLLLGLTVLTALMLAFPGEAFACSCVSSGPPCQNAFHVDAIFAGTVSRISVLPDDGPPLRPGEARIPRAVRVEFASVEGFRGIPSSPVSVVTAGSGPACGYEFRQGGRYLVYASRTADGRGFETSICSRTRSVADAGEDLRFLQTLSAPSGDRAWIYGTIGHWERDLETGTAHDVGPVSDVLVTAGALGHAFTTRTDGRGRYEFRVPPGRYELSASPPAGFSANLGRYTADLPDPRACFAADFGLRFDGRVKGIVRRASGEPAQGVSVELIATGVLGKAGFVQTLRAVSDMKGQYEFAEVPPGRYVIGVDLTKAIKTEVFPTTYHPGTADGAAATVVQLDGGQQRDLGAMTLPAARSPHRITGTVVFQDGSPAARAIISLRDDPTRQQVSRALETGSDGTFSLVAHEGLTYVASASYFDERQRRQISGTFGPFVVVPDMAPLRIVMSAGR
jgi:hypothetical protein